MVLPLGDMEKTRIVPVATYALIALNVVAFLYQLDRGDEFTDSYAATPYEITNNVDLAGPVTIEAPGDENPLDLPGRVEIVRRAIPHEPLPGWFPVWLTIFTAMFLHGSPLHLAGNMLYLWIFGDNVEEVLGTAGYLAFYLGCGVAASLAQIVGNPDSVIPTLGASGAIAGVMGAYVVWFPHNRVRVLFFRILTEMPAFVVVGFWIVLQVWLGFGSIGHLGEVGGVAYLAHVGGAVAGLAVASLLQDRARAVVRRNLRDGWYDQPY